MLTLTRTRTRDLYPRRLDILLEMELKFVQYLRAPKQKTTKFSLNCRYNLNCLLLQLKIRSFMPVLYIRIVLDSFYLLIFYPEKFST